jgi:NADH:ubiquinone oxidoreductase subunit 3 (subunit A)
MRFFSLLDFQYAMLLIFLGLIALVLLYMAFYSHDFIPRRRDKKEEVEEYPGGIQAQNQRIPLILIFVYVGLAIWAVAYVVVIGIRGVPF